MSVQAMKQIEAALRDQAESDSPMPRWQADAYADVLRRLLKDQAVCKALREHSRWPKGSKGFVAGYCYRIRLELNGGEGQKAAQQTARKWALTSDSVKTLASRHKKTIDNRLRKIDTYLHYDRKTMAQKDMTRKQRLLAELKETES